MEWYVLRHDDRSGFALFYHLFKPQLHDFRSMRHFIEAVGRLALLPREVDLRIVDVDDVVIELVNAGGIAGNRPRVGRAERGASGGSGERVRSLWLIISGKSITGSASSSMSRSSV